MLASTSNLALAGLLAGTAAAETVRGVLVFSRHGDRTTKHFGAQVLTPLGAQQCFQVGSATVSRMAMTDMATKSAAIAYPRLALAAKFMGLL